LFKATSLAEAWRDGLLILPNGEEHRRFLVEHPETQPWQAGADALSFLIAALDIDSYVSASTYEAMLLLKPIPAAEEDAESVIDARKVVNQLIDEQLLGPRHHVVEASILRVPRTVAIPAGVANGNPTLAEVRTLAAAAGVRSEFSRRVVLAEQQKCDLVRAKIENYLATLDASDLWDAGKSYSTEVKSHCHGVQIRVKVTADGKANASAVWRHGSELRKFEPDGDLKGEKLERPDWKDVRFQLDREVGDGAAVCGIQPINDTEVAVLIVSRREVK
jgi:hypothetical protein